MKLSDKLYLSLIFALISGAIMILISYIYFPEYFYWLLGFIALTTTYSVYQNIKALRIIKGKAKRSNVIL
jgi:hypothetical protein